MFIGRACQGSCGGITHGEQSFNATRRGFCDCGALCGYEVEHLAAWGWVWGCALTCRGGLKVRQNGNKWEPLERSSPLDHLTTSRPSRVPPVHRLAPASAPMESGRYALSGSPSPTSNGPAVGERGRAQGAEAEFRVSDTLCSHEG